VPFVALRPGAFLDQVARYGGDPFTKNRLFWFGSPTIPLTFLRTAFWLCTRLRTYSFSLIPGLHRPDSELWS
jgi:hypothetical protein